MKLDPFDWVPAVSHAHHLSIVRHRADFKIGRQRVALDRERMVSARRHRVWETFEKGVAVVVDKARLAMKDPRGMTDPGAERGPDSLVAQTHSECRDRRTELPNDIRAHSEIPRVRRVPGARR